ncbi:MAG TPA: glutamine--fructose-6-phosphate transaminase (isomerizing) [Candidatus Babeliales bacterium]|nr:glutamine--fructose-6-phosphate transaminase (isomerizing) [Candidatus Babeliales bacterium]
MCSVVGYIGKGFGKDFILEGLSRLEYRGYDSAGIACLNPGDHRLMYHKAQGQLSNLRHKLDQMPINGHVAIGHTRWATHGGITDENAHPQFNCDKTIAIVHNGIIENHHGLRKELQEADHTFHSSTDSEIIAHLFEAILATNTSFKSCLVELINRLEGAYAIIAMMEEYPDRMVLVRKRSPLCIGIGNDEMFIASDLLAFAGRTKKVLFLPDESFAIVKHNTLELYSFDGKPLPLNIQDIDASWVDQEKQGHEHYMLKEIYEQKKAISATLNGLRTINNRIWDNLGLSAEQVSKITKINLIGCGTSWHAARIAQFYFEEICKIPVKVHLASEFRYMPFFPQEDAIYLIISQSGETADSLEALNLIRSHNCHTIVLTNVASSTMVREADGFLLTHAGHEIAVASTKAFSTQISALFWLANRIALERGLITTEQMDMAEEDLLVAAEVLENSIETYKMPIMHTLAKQYATAKKTIFLGRHISYPFALEAALKLKEISYIFAQCYPAGELKHGPLALVDNETPIFIFSHQDPVIYQKLLSNAQEVKARGGHIIAFTFQGQDELTALADVAFVITHVKPLLGPLSMTGLMQYFVYEVAKQLGRTIDKPRNLAKSVTVE